MVLRHKPIIAPSVPNAPMDNRRAEPCDRFNAKFLHFIPMYGAASEPRPKL